MRSEVRVFPDPPRSCRSASIQGSRDSRSDARCTRYEQGAVAQLGEHLLCKQGVTGSIPVSSTSSTGSKICPKLGAKTTTVYRGFPAKEIVWLRILGRCPIHPPRRESERKFRRGRCLTTEPIQAINKPVSKNRSASHGGSGWNVGSGRAE